MVVDDLDGDLHRRLGPADTAYAMGIDGAVVGRLLWASDTRGVRQMLEAAVSGDDRVERRTRVVPIVRSANEVERILGLAGPRASRDVARVMPPVWVAGRIASALRPLRPDVRAALAAVAATALHIGAAVGVWTLVRRLWSAQPSDGQRTTPDP